MTRTRIALLLAAATAAAAQDLGPAIKVDVDVVNVLCTVRDKQGAYIRDLDKDQFEVRENGKPQTIRYFARETDLPLSVALLIDVSGSVSRLIAREKDAAGQFLTNVMRPSDKALLMGFSSTVALWRDFTSSPELVKKSLERLRPVQSLDQMTAWTPRGGGTLLFDAVYMTAENRMHTQSGRKAMIILSDGIDNGSHADSKLAMRAAQARNAIVYSVYCADRDFEGVGRRALKKLSETTGGRVFRVEENTPLAPIFAEIEEELRSQYSLGYNPTNPARDGTFRKLDVKVRGKGLTVQVRKGYYAFRASGQ